MSADPIERFRRLFERAAKEEAHDATAATLATAGVDARPSARMVLLKGVDRRGFRFFTNYGSAKARQLDANPRAALCFYWPTLGRQVRVEGRVERLPAEESDAYFASRPRGSQLGAWASRQSEPLPRRFTLLRRYAREKIRWAGREISRPPFWGGYLLRPDRIEFWRTEAYRLHDRQAFVRDGEGWRAERLYP